MPIGTRDFPSHDELQGFCPCLTLTNVTNPRIVAVVLTNRQRRAYPYTGPETGIGASPTPRETRERNIMSIKLKALSLGFLAVMAMAGFAAVNASAVVKGHFTHDAADGHATIIGTEVGKKPHDLEFREEGSEAAGITCTHAHYHGDVFQNTVETVTVTPTYTKCGTTSDATWGNVSVHTNGCGFDLYSHGTNTHGTVTVECPAGKAIVITHPNCTITVPPQHPSATHLTGGLTYTTDVGPTGKHTITADVTVKKITGQFHGGICIFLGTSHSFEMNGALTVEGFDTAGNPVNLTHT